MNWLSPPPQSDSSSQPIDRIGFDMIRAIVGARQSACATVQALRASAEPLPSEGADHRDARMAMLAGRNQTIVNGGAFASAAAADGTCPKGDECHG